jgi:hypothetical protein
VSTPEEKLSTPSEHAGPARCTLEQLRARWGRVEHWRGGVVQPMSYIRPDPAVMRDLRVGDEIRKHAMNGWERWRVEKIEGKRVDLVQEVKT